MALIERMDLTTETNHWRGEIPMNYVYTAGRGHDLFFTNLRDKGKFVGTRCEACGIVYLPPSLFCERCFERIEGNTVEIPNQGVVKTFTVCHETYQGERKAEPSIMALIQMEGTVGGLIHRIGKVAPEACTIGMPVKAVLKGKSKRVGGILDIEHFVPV